VRALSAAPARGGAAGAGFNAEFYDDAKLGHLAFTEIDPVINYNWGTNGFPREKRRPVSCPSAAWCRHDQGSGDLRLVRPQRRRRGCSPMK